jgi:hypothetical protein
VPTKLIQIARVILKAKLRADDRHIQGVQEGLADVLESRLLQGTEMDMTAAAQHLIDGTDARQTTLPNRSRGEIDHRIHT